LVVVSNQNKARNRKTKYQIGGQLIEIYYRIVAGQKDRDIMRGLLLSERNYYKLKQKLSSKLVKYQLERDNSAIWLEVQTLKDRMSKIYSALAEKVIDPTTKTSDLSNLASIAESIAINIFKLDSASITAIQQPNILENQINIQLPSRSKNEELPKIMYKNNNRELVDLEENAVSENKNNKNSFYSRFNLLVEMVKLVII
jgi:hypothetical protein